MQYGKKQYKCIFIRNSNTIKIIKNSVSNIISRCANRNIKLTLQPRTFIRSTKIVKATFHNIIIQSTYL